MNKRIIIFLFFLLFFIIPISSAETLIKVKTLASHKVSIFVLDASQVYYLLESYHKTSDANGIVSVSYSEKGKDINIRIIVSKDEQNIVSEKFGPYKPGESIYILALLDKKDGNYKEEAKVENKSLETNITPNETVKTKSLETNITPNETVKTKKEEAKKGVTGLVVESRKDNLIMVYVAIGIVILIILYFIWKKYTEKKLTKGKKSNISERELERRLQKTQREYEEAQKEINRLKNRDKIKEIERRIAEEKKEIESLRKG